MSEAVVVRSEEQLHVTTRPMVVGRAILRQVIVTEERTITVQVRHEEVRLEVVDLDEPLDPALLQEAAHVALPEFILREEEVVVSTRLMPVERVRLTVERMTGQRAVTDDLRKEQITVTTLKSSAPEGRTASV